ncbi:TRAP-type C4-dicarboxylate transport system, substrate-binding protein [Monaibacterium marinum]|uniref:TRAP-type C4-dicarboxylate transport system, substrate-binding protein n=1 Tax=Pontivivens marinum TaxID=1690039 RepID=A0A2C9CRA4_9RHOB|nr:TRAP transporter substrate-binding protein [Monaibacterium marinum]SOH93757.1 TRAP-type C4-dicarboxylate transport system, substrate-binding protein [Monaibacterium marinum]
MTKQDDTLASAERRNFLKLASTGSFTAALVAGAAGTLWSTEAAAQTANEERERQQAAEHTMVIATAYVLGASRSYPIMQLDLKENIQNASFGKIYVQLAPAGQLGAGGELVSKVQSQTIHAAQHSLANFAAFAPVVDLVNMPYLCGSNQRFVNMVNSDHWKTVVEPQVNARGFKPMFYVVIDPRVVAVRAGGAGPVITPDDMQGVKFRVPGSELLQQYYRMVGANPTPIAWGETPSAIQQGVADALDPSAGALYVFGFKDMLSHVTFTRAVPDAQVFSCNLEWFNELPLELQEAIDFASEITRDQNLAKVPAARNFAIAELNKVGVEFHSLSDDQLAQWQEAGGYQRSEWDRFKVELAGSMGEFDQLVEAAETQGRLHVHDA